MSDEVDRIRELQDAWHRGFSVGYQAAKDGAPEPPSYEWEDGAFSITIASGCICGVSGNLPCPIHNAELRGDPLPLNDD